MIAVYQKENTEFAQKIYDAKYYEMFVYLEKELGIGC
jgi:hypothetical protein